MATRERAAEPIAGSDGSDGGAEAERHPEIDWVAAERSPEFKELVAAKRRFVVPATAFFMLWYFGFVALAGYAPDFMGESIYEGFTVGYALALTQFVMVWVLGAWYLRRANRVFDPLAERAAARAVRESEAAATDAGNGGSQQFDPRFAERAAAERAAAQRASAPRSGEVRR